mgnify:CR=1 FL=1
MSKGSLINSCEVIINSAIKRLTTLEGKNKTALESEFKEWIDAVESEKKCYDVLFVNKIN